MIPYANISGTSGVIGYEIGDDYVNVIFNTRYVYTYTYSKAGFNHIEKMKILASEGLGLNSYININVKKKYTRKFKL